ncbi:uncharacterized protein METZ01_LOCUS274481, partial [marine metagenome]
MIKSLKNFLLVALAALMLVLGSSKIAFSKTVEIVMAAPDWPPTRFMQEYFNTNFQ